MIINHYIILFIYHACTLAGFQKLFQSQIKIKEKNQIFILEY